MFDLHIGPNKWTSVILDAVGNASVYEMIHALTQDRLQVCLVKTGETTPFISSLELRPLDNETYVTESGSLITVSRFFFAPTPPMIRYDEDIHDRGWNPYLLDEQMVSISTDILVDTEDNFYDVPQLVVMTAAVPRNASQPLTLYLSLDETTAEAYIYMHFAEIQKLGANENREFSITFNDDQVGYAKFRPPNFTITTLFTPEAISSLDGNFKLTFAMTGNSTHPPLINAVEIYRVLELTEPETNQDEVSAMVNIKRSYELEKKVSWQGDPCAPKAFRWEGLNCNYPKYEPQGIISLNLTENKLTGSITPEFAKLTQLVELNLCGNPNLNSTIPNSLQKRLTSNSLTLILSEIPLKESKKVPVIAIAAPVAGMFALVVVLAIFFVIRKKKSYSTAAPGPPSVTTGTVQSETRSSNPTIITKDLRVTYPEVLKMTNNFQRVLGKGGFGTVYHGNFDDAQVAVKMLSHSSAQGYKEFNAEVELLSRVHHRHLVRLVGYCDDGDNLALIYEYMANGDLKEHMSGLEYLHNGCQPPMVHRDVKTTNILLNERYGAKLADFGLSRSFPIDGEYHVSTAVAGTPGYLDPEYHRTNSLSEKSDIYSFGIVLLEIITNQPVIDKTRERTHINEWAVLMLTKGDIRNLIDPKLMGDYDTTGAWKIVELALACVNPSSNRRPTMAHVVIELNECVALENARRQGSEEMSARSSVNFSLSSASEFIPGAR
uniref:Protein kinase domain-containing protein n=1 Tax=Brassica campestris TaxID=3711 RepID=M4ENP1_BRACM